MNWYVTTDTTFYPSIYFLFPGRMFVSDMAHPNPLYDHPWAIALFFFSILSLIAWLIIVFMNDESFSMDEGGILGPLLGLFFAIPGAFCLPLYYILPRTEDVLNALGYISFVITCISGVGMCLPVFLGPLLLWSSPFILIYVIYNKLHRHFGREKCYDGFGNFYYDDDPTKTKYSIKKRY